MSDERDYKPSEDQLRSARDGSFLPIEKFVEAYPPREPFVQRSISTVYLHAGSRFQIAYERSSDIGYGVWRDEKLGEMGISGHIEDSAAFGKDLIEALADQMSLRNLRDLQNALSEEIAAQEEQRRQRIAGQSA